MHLILGKTCFVGGLPENITEVIIHEIFERCGEITTLRLSKKNFCHIRFTFEASVDSAIYLSGYRVKIGNNNDPGNTGKLHVDYAQARDDQVSSVTWVRNQKNPKIFFKYEYECRQRQLQREQRHKEKNRPRALSSPPLIAHYTDHEAASVAEKIKNDETFLKAVSTLITWLERGDCVKKNANIFYSMIQSTNSHIRRLLNEKQQHEGELREAKEKYQKQMIKMGEQCEYEYRLWLSFGSYGALMFPQVKIRIPFRSNNAVYILERTWTVERYVTSSKAHGKYERKERLNSNT